MGGHQIKKSVVDAFLEVKRDVKDLLYGNTRNNAFGPQAKLLDEARHSVVFALANTEIEQALSFDSGLVGNYIGNLTPLDDIKNGCLSLIGKTKAGSKAMQAVGRVGKKVSAFLDKIKDKLANFFRGMIDRLRKQYPGFVTATWAAELGVWLAAEFADNITTAVSGWSYVQNAADMYEGVKTATYKAKDFMTQMYKGVGVELLNGHPACISKALARHSLAGLAGGVAKASIAGGKMAAETSTLGSGVGVLVSVLSGLLERVIGLVDKVVQSHQVNKILKQAQEVWSKQNAGESSILSDNKSFAQWFQNSVIYTPVIAAIVMGSGLVNHPNLFLKLLDKNGMLVSQNTFDRGTHYINELSKQSGAYIREYSDAYGVKISSSDAFLESQYRSLRDNTRKY
ncbi:hypothetical protein OPW41_11525 [Vibrio europaeus]|uniref:hypothetical protein n=1 Tax=Vibrio europaeus TaxID=300876 RepID=UPI00233F2226|nr:hypothetical protein [Vibrio europaeus]MDC5721990.1 hypothetical protein [Vibrio europaeus]MDC5758113.1 hypothetical protein [Vibrio europaeus]MDC5776309.1 hypothetical protein [Vibrio europaeus]MDC5795459.1 hypothetical protein [Vibrio europaeus]MDC5798368.1 hypothetical protein [Vibrio europaeus]